MLELRPSCEHCDADLPPASADARICSFECTFCVRCADEVLGNVCPNCGGGFAPRPVRPAADRRNGNFLGNYPATTARKHRPADLAAHAALLRQLRDVPARER
ncbi:MULTISPECIES: DUF1272 domain-containing protein [Achromobacter]|uniref:DUF1272 domain-containing protein n=3 Tax=Achromobacter TaxID=222 RepID=A0A7T4B3S6_9BURK|nr:MULTISPECIES: DUF1272 domain-containing protein [Achromobacter]AMG36798.1 DUF1272 domain-containing protein [Achromobacter xylosoxidans]EGP45269.1 hypothetical protein AXXA_16761 [Achromobacter insuavis AXX-A]QQB35144.1 DUF1272 domain-containing protein [Achromobacter deleyi]